MSEPTRPRHLPRRLRPWIAAGLNVRAVRAKGMYMDIGSVSGLKLLYKSL